MKQEAPAFRRGAVTSNIKAILDQPGPVFVAMKVVPEVENTPIGQRRRWHTRSRDQVVHDLRQELGDDRVSVWARGGDTP